MNLSSNLQQKSKEELISLISSLQEDVAKQATFISNLREQLALAKHRHFGSKSEKVDPAQGMLFDEATNDNQAEVELVDEALTTVTYSRKKTNKTRALPKDLPRIEMHHDISEEDKVCDCGCTLERIGQDVTEQLDIIPAKVQVIQHVKYKYACKSCEQNVKTAKPKQPIEKSIASPGLLAHVMINKYQDYLPLFRQEQIFKRLNIDLPRNTMANWMIKCGQLLIPIYNLLLDNINNYDIAFADETRAQVLNEPGREAKQKGYMWCFIGGAPDKRSYIYHYCSGRAHTTIEELLPDFKGYLHCDGFAGYTAYAVDHDCILVGCWAHVRRKFVEITKAIKKSGIAHSMVALIAKLYEIERKLKSEKKSIDEIYQCRQKKSKPIIEKIEVALQDASTKVLPKSPIGQAIIYALNQWPKLIKYIEDGRCDIDNNRSERAIKPFVMGRKNWLFSQSMKGIEASQIIYSLIETAKAHKLEPYNYMRYVLEKISYAAELSDFEKLLPYNLANDQIKPCS